MQKRNHRILVSVESVLPYVDSVRKASDANRGSLGFIPAGVFAEFARRSKLLICEAADGEGWRYAGHVLFDDRFPRAKILQLYVLEEYRGQGMAKSLLSTLKDALTKLGFTSIYARVASDLVDSNAVWESQGFQVQRVEAGGVTRGRKILVRCCELDAPQLFPRSGVETTNPLGIGHKVGAVSPTYLLDLNVLFDVGPRRRRHDDFRYLLRASSNGHIQLAISEEIRKELNRTATDPRTDPMMDFVGLFPSFPVPDEDVRKSLLAEISTMIFPERAKTASLRRNDISDMNHLATVIVNQLDGLITNDDAVVSVASDIRTKYGIDVISTSAFKLDVDETDFSASHDGSADTTLRLTRVDHSEDASVRSFLCQQEIPAVLVAKSWLSPDVQVRMAVWHGSEVIGFSGWSAGLGIGQVSARMVVDRQSEQASDAAHMLLTHLIDQFSASGPCSLVLDVPAGQSQVREVANGLGFFCDGEAGLLSKMVAGYVLTEFTWEESRRKIQDILGLRLPEKYPELRSITDPVRVVRNDGNQVLVPVEKLESILTPALFCFPDRHAVITPISKVYSDHLLRHSTQASLLPAMGASLYFERHYLSDRKTFAKFRRGSLIYFYESARNGGRGELVAVARISRSYLRAEGDMTDADFRKSVLDGRTVGGIGKGKIKAVTAFDNIFLLEKAVPLKRLKAIGCGESHQLLSTSVITGEQSMEILREAFPRV